MSRAIDHPFLDKIGTYRAKGGNLNTESVCYVAGTLSTWTKMCNGSQILFFTRC